jgi:hypothetical protein
MFFSGNSSRFSSVALLLGRASSALLLFNNQIIFVTLVFTQTPVNTAFAVSVPTLEKGRKICLFQAFQ